MRYDGNWDPEPGAWPRFSRFLQWAAGAAAGPVAVPAAELAPGLAPLAHLTGTAAYAPTDAEAAALRALVDAGGVLLVDACGGSLAFAESVERQLLPAAFPGLRLYDAADGQPPLSRTFGVGDDLSERGLRPFLLDRPVPGAGRLRVGAFDKGHVVYSPIDLTTGLAGSKQWGVAGYTPDHSIGVVKNVLLWAAADGR